MKKLDFILIDAYGITLFRQVFDPYTAEMVNQEMNIDRCWVLFKVEKNNLYSLFSNIDDLKGKEINLNFYVPPSKKITANYTFKYLVTRLNHRDKINKVLLPLFFDDPSYNIQVTNMYLYHKEALRKFKKLYL